MNPTTTPIRRETTPPVLRRQLMLFESAFLFAFLVSAGVLAYLTVPAEKWLLVGKLLLMLLLPLSSGLCVVLAFRLLILIRSGRYNRLACVAGVILSHLLLCLSVFLGSLTGCIDL